MRPSLIILLLFCAVVAIAAEEGETRDLDVDLPEDIDSEDLERKHRKRKKHGQQGNPCGGYGRTFGSHDTYISAPVMNYFFGCGGLPQYPAQGGHGHGGHGGHGHGGHGHGGHGGGHGGHGSHGGGHGGHGGHGGGHGGYGNQGGYGGSGFYGGQGFYPQQGFQQGYQQGYQPGYNQGFSGQYNRPFQTALSSAASGIGTALVNYISRPRKVQKQVNQLLRPIYKLF